MSKPSVSKRQEELRKVNRINVSTGIIMRRMEDEPIGSPIQNGELLNETFHRFHADNTGLRKRVLVLEAEVKHLKELIQKVINNKNESSYGM